MTKIKFFAFTLILALLFSCSQQKRYISYKVKEGETMRDIAERINVKKSDLIRLNPDIGETPSTNSVIIIPNPEYKKKIPLIQKPDSDNNQRDSSENPGENSAENSNQLPDSTQVVRTVFEYKTHTVTSGETVYRITKKYNISKKELIKLNPEFPRIKDNYLDVGQVIKVKVAEKKVFYISREEDLKNHVTHKVKSKETVYGLTRFYNISKDDLIRLNPEYPGIIDNELGIGQVLRIRPVEEKLDTDETSSLYLDSIADTNSIKLALLLPFRAKEYENINYEDIFDKKKNKKSKSAARLANIVTDFYMGAEMAIDSLKKEGVNVDVSVFDTGNRGKNIDSIIEQDKLVDSDVIIGPFYSKKAELIAKDVNVPVIFPHFSKNQHDFSSSKIVKSTPDKETHSKFLVNHLKGIYTGETVFIVGDGSEASNKQVETILNGLKKHDSIQKIHVLKPKDNYIKKERFTKEMKVGVHNWVILTSDKNAAVADAINSMVVLPKNITAQVFAIEKNSAYDEVDNNTLARIDFTYVTSNYSDYKSENIKEFNKKYRSRNKDIPSEYSFKGFDITYDILMRLASGEKLSETFKQGVSLRLENKFDYTKKLFGPISNKGLYIVKYNRDLSLERLR